MSVEDTVQIVRMSIADEFDIRVDGFDIRNGEQLLTDYDRNFIEITGATSGYNVVVENNFKMKLNKLKMEHFSMTSPNGQLA